MLDVFDTSEEQFVKVCILVTMVTIFMDVKFYHIIHTRRCEILPYSWV